MAIILSPETIFKLHRMLKNKKYSALFSNKKIHKKRGPKGPSQEVINAIVEMKKRNSRMGCPKIALTIANTFGVDIDKDVVRRVLRNHYNPGPFDYTGLSWLTLLGNLKDSLWSVDLFRLESINLKTHWVMIIIDQYTRRIIGFSALETNSLNGANVCMMFNKIMRNISPPKRISSDHDPLFYYFQWKANLRIYGIKEIKTIPFTPISHPFIERVIGTTRREYLDHTLFANANDLEIKLGKYQAYYNEHRNHLSLQSTPGQIAGEITKKIAQFSDFQWQKFCKGLFQVPCAS